LRVRQFAKQDLGFNVGDSYTSLTEVSRPPIVHVVTAAPRTSLEPYTWWFPIVGRVAYKGYFQEESARKEAQSLEAEGYDSYIRQAAAFSTLGWFDDPLLPHLLHYDHETLANIIFHELFHSTFYLKGYTAFNESLANFAGHRAAIVFFAKESGPTAKAAQQAEASWQRQLQMSAFLAKGTERLVALYASSVAEAEKLSQREKLFAQIQQEYRALPGLLNDKSPLASGTLNNAILLHHLVYLQELALFEQAYQQTGQDLQRTLTRITESVEDTAEPFAAVKTQLERSAQAFSAIASPHNSDPIIAENRINAQNRNAVKSGLCNQHTIKGVFMRAG
jgi:predicted aminopeptidase